MEQPPQPFGRIRFSLPSRWHADDVTELGPFISDDVVVEATAFGWPWRPALMVEFADARGHRLSFSQPLQPGQPGTVDIEWDPHTVRLRIDRNTVQARPIESARPAPAAAATPVPAPA